MPATEAEFRSISLSADTRPGNGQRSAGKRASAFRLAALRLLWLVFAMGMPAIATAAPGNFRYVKLVQLSEVNGKAFGSGAEFNVLDGSGAVINRTGWTVTADSSVVKPARPASNLVDGNPGTFWHTEYVTTVVPLPHQLIVDLGTGSTIGGFRYLPRQDTSLNGTIAQYAFYVSTDGVEWGAPVAQGTFARDNTEKTVTFAPPSAQNQQPVITNPGAATGTVGTAATLAIVASDPDGDPLTYAASGLPAGLSIAAATGVISGTPTLAGESTVTVTVADGQGGGATTSFPWTIGAASAQPGTYRFVKLVQLSEVNGKAFGSGAEFNVLDGSGAVIDRTGWTVTADSAAAKPARPASTLMDGNPATFWHTEYVTTVAPLPHHLIVDLGTSRTIGGFRYLPRQDASLNGTIAQYAFYVSTDGVEWGAPVAQGTFARDKTEKSAAITPPVAQNQQPVVGNPGAAMGTVGTAATLGITASDPDGDALTYAASGLPAGLSMAAATGMISGTPTLAGESTVTVTVTDGKGGSATASFVWTVVSRDSPQVIGQWGPTINFTTVPVAAALLPTGKLIIWSSFDREEFRVGSGPRNSTFTNTYDPATGAVTESLVTNPAHDMFCPGTALLEDGRLFVNGGGPYVKTTSIFDATSETWASNPSMSRRRWYNASSTMPDGKVFTLGGIPDDGVGELWTAGGGWQVLGGAPITPMITDDGVYMNRSEQHPKLFVAPNGKVFAAGPSPNMQWYDTAGSGAVESAGRRGNDIYAQNNVAVMYAEGKILTAGGGTVYAGPYGPTTPSSNKAHLIDINGATATARETTPMGYLRSYANGVVLPDGRIFVVGGATNGRAFTDEAAVMVPEMFDPNQETWTEMAVLPTPRTYHSVALLMPDGRVFSGGGGLCGTCTVNHNDGQMYSPSYLFKGARPEITSAPTSVEYNQPFTVTATAGVARYTLIRISSTTHTVNTDQRFLELSFTPGGSGSYTVTAPRNGNVAPPGYYMLFALNANGVPSVAKMIKIARQQHAPVITPPGNQSSFVGSAVTLSVAANDADGDAVNYTATGLPAGLSIDAATGLISGAPTAAATSNVTLTVTDARGGSSTASFEWAVEARVLPPGAFRYVKLVELREINGKPFGSGAEFNVLDGSGAVINRSGWTITADSSLAQPPQPASRLIDGNTTTIWHTEYVTAVAPVPHQIVVDMGTGSTVSGFRYLPRQDGKVNGTIGRYAFYVSMDGVNWGTPIAQGTFASDTTEKAVTFAPPPAPNQTPVVSNPGSPVGAVGTAVSLAITASDPDGDKLSYAASGLPAGLVMAASTGVVSGTPTAVGESAVTVTVTDGRGGSATASFVWKVGAAGSLNQLGLAAIAAPPRTVGVSVSYTAEPSGGVNPKISWNFGDGTGTSAPSATTTVSHTFSSPGLYLVEARATDDSGQSSVRQFLQAVHYPLTANPPAASTNIVYDAQRSWIWNVNPDADTVTVFDDQTQTKVAEIAVGKAPKSLALGPGARMWVVNEGSASISLIDATTTPPSVVGTVPLPAASEPYGLVFDAAGVNAYVALQATGRLLVLDALSGSETAQVDVGPHPRHLSVTADGTRVLVSRFITPPLPGEDTAEPRTTDASGAQLGGEVVVVDAATRQIVKTVTLQHSDAPDMTVSGRGIPNYLGAPVISPDGRSAWVPSKQDNIKRGTLRDLGANLTFENTVRAISSRVDLQTWSEDYAARLDHDNSGVGSAVVFDPTGSYFFVALEASREVAVVDAYNRHELMRFDVGRAPEGLALSSDARKLFVHNFMDRTVGVYDVSALTLAGSLRIDPLVTYAAVSAEQLPAQVLRGKQLFYDARDPQVARDGYLSCAACHNDGGHDGRTWDLTGFGEGVRDTISLKGHGGMAHGQLHWSGNFDEVQDFEGQIRDLAGGTGLMADSEFYSGTRSEPLGDAKTGHSADLDALAAYVASLSKTPGSPYRNPDGSLTALASQGRAVFTDPASGNCVACHSDGRGLSVLDPLTDSRTGATPLLHDVGTIKPASGSRLGGLLSGFDTPTLRGLWTTAPYLHDGSAATLEDAVKAHTGVSIAPNEMPALLEYLRQLDDKEG